MQPGTTIEYGGYYLTRKIATGGMAELFRARKVGEAGFEKLVVIKRLLPHLAANEELRDMFLDEARLASQLNHQNIAQVYDLGKAQERGAACEPGETTYFIAMEYIFGKSLAEIYRRSQQTNTFLSTENVVRIIINAALGLEYAHTKKSDAGVPLGIVHRDVSPQNILVSYEGEVKLVDFGIAKALSQSQATRPGVLKGKFSYMAPEQAKGEPVDARADIYALGVVFWEMLTGQRLFTGQSEAEILAKVSSPSVSPPSMVKKALPPELDQICLRCLAPETAARYARLKDLSEDLETYLQQLSTYPSSYALRNHMHELFGPEIKQETEDIQKEIDSVRKFLSQGACAPAPSEATVIYGPKKGKGKGLILAGAGAALAAAIAIYFLTAGPPAGEKTAAPAAAPAASKSAPPAAAKPPAPKAQAQAATPAGTPSAAPLPAPRDLNSKNASQKQGPTAPAPQPPEVKPSVTETTPPLLTQARQDIIEKKYDKALAALDDLAKQAPGQALKVNRDRARALIGRAMENLNQAPEKSLVDLAQAAELAPDWALVHFQAGRAQTRLKRFTEAVKSYDKALELDPKLDGAYFNRGYLYMQEKQFKEAAQDFQRVVDLDSPYKSDAYVNLAICHYRLDDKPKALEMLKQALVANPNNRLAQDYLNKLKGLPNKK